MLDEINKAIGVASVEGTPAENPDLTSLLRHAVGAQGEAGEAYRYRHRVTDDPVPQYSPLEFVWGEEPQQFAARYLRWMAENVESGAAVLAGVALNTRGDGYDFTLQIRTAQE